MRFVVLPLLMVMIVPASAQDASEAPRRGNVLSVRGTGQFTSKPDLARIEVAVVTRGKTLDGAVEAHRDPTRRAQEILKALETAGVTVEKSVFRLNREPAPYRTADNPNPKPPDLPFTAITELSLTIKSIDAVDDAVNRLAASGIMEVRKITYAVASERQALNEARRAAVLDAREQARTYADAADLKLVEITEITDGEATPPEGYADMPRSRVAQIIPPAVVTFSAGVTIRWRIAPR